MEKEAVLKLLQSVESNSLSAEEAFAQLKLMPFENLEYARVDHHRSIRQGIAEVIYGAGKTKEQIAGITEAMVQAGQKTILITRISPEAAA